MDDGELEMVERLRKEESKISITTKRNNRNECFLGNVKFLMN